MNALPIPKWTLFLLLFVIFHRSLYAQPDIRSFWPVSAASGATVHLYGLNFTGTTSVKFGAVAAASFTLVSDTAIDAIVGTGASGGISVSNPNGSDTLSGFTFLSDSLKPKISGFSPASGATGNIITISGAHFTGASSVSFGTVSAASYTVVSDSSIIAQIGSGASGAVRVINPKGRDSLNGFTYIPPSYAPRLLSFYPVIGYTGTMITITGIHLTGTNAVSFGGVNATSFTVNSDSSITAIVGAGASGLIRITGSNSGVDSVAGFTFLPNPIPPVIANFSPSSGTTGTVVTISGTHFNGTNAVSFGGIGALSFTVISDSSIRAVVGNGATGYIRVTNTSGNDSVVGFTFVATPFAPDIQNFSPAAAKTGAVITIKGTHFTGAIAVNFGGVEASAFSIISDSIITAVVGSGASGYISISTVSGAGSMDGFSFIQASPKISAFTPQTGSSGTTVRIIGTNFRNTTSVSFGGIPAVKFIIVSDSAIDAVVGNGSTGFVSLVTPGGVDSLSGFTFKQGLSSYPNPATTYEVVTIPLSSSTSMLKLTDLSGKQVKAQEISPNTTQVTINLSGIQPGVYIITWTDGTKSLKKTILVE